MNNRPKLENINKEVLSKIAKTYGKEKTIYEHTKDVLDNYNNFFEDYPNSFNNEEKELIYLACLYHDLGKSNELFQKKIRGFKSESEIPHSFLSPLFLPLEKIKEEYGETNLKVLNTAIFYHHTREYDISSSDYLDYAKIYVKEPFHIENNFFPSHPKYGVLFKYPSAVGKNISDNVWQQFTKIKGMLNRFDYSASSGYQNPEIKNHNLEISKNIKNNFNNLTEMQKYALENSNKNLILIGSTGSGKTESSLLWLNNSKGFYTLPLKVASNAIYKRIKDDYAIKEKDAVALLHSDSFEILNKENIEYEEYKQMKLLSSPLTICTVDQIFKFPFKALGQEIYAATLSYSKVIIDEIQMYSPIILACIITGLKRIIENNGKFLIITATFPKFLKNKLSDIIDEKNYEIKSFITESEIKRHFIKIIENDFDYKKIIKNSKNKKVLIICNTVSRSINVYQNLKELNAKNIHLLHARFIKKDRENLENEIKSFAKSTESGIWVTTQLVEASLDIDFDELHTELAPADSLIQRFGRCYRKREYQECIPNVYIYHNDSKNFIYDEKLLFLSLEQLKKYDNKLFSELDKTTYLDSVYDEQVLKDNKVKYIEELEEKLIQFKNIMPMRYNNEEIQKLFRDINTINVIPDSIYNTNEKQINKYIDIIKNKTTLAKEKYEAKRELLRFTVPVYHLKNAKETKIEGLDIYRTPGNYSSEIGFERTKEDEDRFI